MLIIGKHKISTLIVKAIIPVTQINFKHPNTNVNQEELKIEKKILMFLEISPQGTREIMQLIVQLLFTW